MSVINRSIVAALPKCVKGATYREVVRFNRLDVSVGLERAVEGLIFARGAAHLFTFVPEATRCVIRSYITRGLWHGEV